MSAYTASFADFYDALTETVEYPRRAAYFDAILKKYGNGDPLLLDLACGTGSLSIEMAKLGYDVIGVDGSYDMLAIAREKAAEGGQDILFLCQMMQKLDLFGTIDGAVCCLDSINHVTSPADVRRIFQRVSLFLNDGGVFVFDANTIWKHREILGNQPFVYDTDDVFCVWQNEYEENNQTVAIHLDFFEREDDHYFRREEDFSERAYAQEELCAWLDEAGLEVVGVFDELSEEAPREDSQRLVYVARKHRSVEEIAEIMREAALCEQKKG